MDQFLVALALVLQASDAAATCRTLARGGIERNPILPQSCPAIVAIKAGTLAPLVFLKGPKRTVWAVAMSASGGVGLVLSWR